jgi:ligand-binding sensor domain-containing protein
MLNSILFRGLLLGSCWLFACEGTPSSPSQNLLAQTIPKPPPTDTLLGNDAYFVDSREAISAFGPNSITRSMTQDAQGNYWFASWQGIIRYDGQNFTNMTLMNGLQRFHVFNSRATRNGEIWFGTIRGGVYRFDGQSFRHYTTRDGLSDNWVEWIFEDNTGNIWLGGNEGLNRFDGQKMTHITGPGNQKLYEVHSITQDKAGNIWVGTGDGVWIYDHQKFTEFKLADGESLSNTRSVITDRSGNIWMAGATGLYRYDGKQIKRFFDGFAGYVYEDKKGAIWFAGSDKGTSIMKVYQILEDTPVQFMAPVYPPMAMVFFIYEDQKGNIWFGADDRGVIRYDGKTFERFGG